MPIYTKPGQETITKAPPIDFLSTGEPLISVDVLGNARQTGTPSPQNIIMPDLVGVRTGNLFHYGESWNNISFAGVDYECVNKSKIRIHGKATAGKDISANISDIPSGQYSARIIVDGTINDDQNHTFNIEVDGVRKMMVFSNNSRDITTSFTGQITRAYTIINGTFDGDITISIMLNSGTTALPYEPYGYAIPFTCASQTVPVYLGQTPTLRRIKKLVLTGEEANWTAYVTYANGYQFKPANANLYGADTVNILCTHYKGLYGLWSLTQDTVCFSADGNRLRFKDTSCADLTAFKSYLAAQYAAGTPVTVWYVLETPTTAIVNEPLAKIGDYADELHSADAQITIPTTAGHNTLTVDTTLPPSSVSITAPDIYHQVDRIMCNVNGTQTEIAKVVDNQNNLIFTPKNWFGFKIDTTNDNSSTAVTYTHSAVTMTPAFMDYTNGVFNYGSWKDVWFIKNSYPVALNFDGTEAYKLDPDDYTKRLDGTPSDIQYVLQTEEPSNWSTQWKQYYTKSGDDYVMNSQSEAPTWAADTYYTLTCLSSTVNFMLAFPKVYFRRYTDSQYNHVEIADRKIDNNWYAYAHVNTNGVEVDYIYLPLFKGSIVDSKLRSIPGVIPTGSTTASAEVDAATALGSRWQIWDHSSRELINDLLILMSKSIDCQTAFGRGRESGYNAADTVTYGKLPTGTAIRKGPFYGSSTSLSEVKVFGMESFWANRWDRLQGILLVDNVWKIKMTPPYNFTGTDFTTLTQFDVPSGNGYLSKVTASQYGSIPASISGGASNKFYRDYFYKSDTGTRVGHVGGSCDNGAYTGFRYVNVYAAASSSTWNIGASPVYK